MRTAGRSPGMLPPVKLPAFEYHRPATLAEAVEVMGGLDDAKVLAGGQSLLPVLALRIAAPSHLVDVGGIAELREVREHDGFVCIGAGVRQAQVPPEPQSWSECTRVGDDTGYPSPQQVIASTVPSWSVGLLLHLLLAAALVAGAIARTHAPTRRTAAGSRVA